jgi:hypothetical protein
MSNALAVQRPSLTSLDVPGAMFSPSELVIGPSTSQDEFLRIGKALSSIDTASDLWQCDFALHGMRSWGTDAGLALAAKATGYTRHFLKRCARIAERFTPDQRYTGLTRNHYRRLLPFDAEQIDAWLPTVIHERLSAGSLYALAVDKFGRPEKSRKYESRHSLWVTGSLWARLAPHAPSKKVTTLIELILEEWLEKPADAHAIVLAIDELRSERKKENKKPSTEESREKDAARMRERRANAKNDAVGSSRIVDPQAADTQIRPTYAERRAAQIAAGGKPIPAKDRVYKSRIKIVFVRCQGNTFVESDEGKVRKLSEAARADCFYTELAAENAALEYSADRGYTVWPRQCEHCSGKNGRKIWHVYRDRPAEVQTKSAQAGAARHAMAL